jgi:RNA polymerase sigma-70 factor (ECF subfamily)
VDSLLAAARAGDEQAFERLVVPHHRELQAHCYRMLGSLHDAEDALQETMVAAWRGLAGFEGRSSVRTWLYRIATNCCLRQAERRPPRILSWDHVPSLAPDDVIGEPVLEPIWLDPWPSDPAEVAERRETIGLAYVAALQHLPPTQRAVLILREVLAFSADEVADMLDTTTASVNSALQRARAAVADRVVDGEPDVADEHRPQLEAFVDAFERSDVDALVALLTEDVRFTMPPLPAWYDGRADVLGFLGQRVFATPWRLEPVTANGQPAYACYMWTGSAYTLGAVNVLSFRDGRISWIAAFVDPAVTARFGRPKELAADR